MKKLYKDGKECNAEDNQVDIMLNAGWSLEKSKVEATEPEESGKSVRKVPRKKIITKKTDSEE